MRRLLLCVILTMVGSRLATATQCSALNAFTNSGTDAGPTFETCVNTTIGAGGTLEVPAGLYMIGTRVNLSVGFTLTTLGKSGSDPTCAYTGSHTCAEFRAMPTIDGSLPMIIVDSGGSPTTFSWIILDGNKSARSEPKNGQYTIRTVKPDHLTVKKCVSRNAFFGTGWEVYASLPTYSAPTNLDFEDNVFAFNGTHDGAHYSDGLTIHQAVNSLFLRNIFEDNTDVDFVLGGCAGCTIQYNTITHGLDWSSSSNACLLIHGWPYTSGDYTGSEISFNSVDGGANRNCGGGFVVGPKMWYTADTFGGNIHDNISKNGQTAIAIAGITGPITFSNNIAENSATSTKCNDHSTFFAWSYSADSTSLSDLVRTSDVVPTSWYHVQDWTGCVPNSQDPADHVVYPPYISNFPDGTVLTSTTSTTATATWTSGSALTSEVQYGSTTAYGSTSGINYALVTSHSVTLTGLTPNTTYHLLAKQKTQAQALTDYSADIVITTGTQAASTLRGLSGLRGGATIR